MGNFAVSLAMISLILMRLMFMLSMEVSANPLSRFCSDNTTDIYTSNCTFENNLKQLLESLPSNTAATGGFYNTSVGDGADQVYGKALCRGDVNTSTCQNCVKNGGQDILGLCNKTKEAIVWFDQCQVHYSSQKFSSIDNGKYPDPESNKLETEISDDVEDFEDVLELLVTNITTNAISDSKLFGFGKVEFGKEFVYGLAQCSRDISASECQNCLNFTIEELKSCCYSRTGGSALRRNCNVSGYMAPEYAMEGLYSIKSDVFSFGVLLLEIITGRRNAGFNHSNNASTLVAYAWHLWNEGKVLELMDPLLTDGCPDEFLRFIHIGLLCVQEDAYDRPTMSSVVVMLKGETVTLSQPQQPAFALGRFGEFRQTLNKSGSVNGLTISNIAAR